MAGLELTGDVIELDGQVVGRLVPGLTGTLRGRVEEAVNNAYEDDDKNLRASEFDDVMQSLKNAAIAKATAKMISLDELDAIIKQISEGEL